MPDKAMKIPGPDHPITVTPNPARVVITLAGRTIADSRNALTLQEASYPAVQYIPRADVEMTLLAPTDHTSHCPYKGDASYFSVPTGGERLANAIWSYEAPHEAVGDIKGHLAFYPDRFEITQSAA